MTCMKTMTATQASRGFSALLDAVEHESEQVLVVRDGHPVALISPAPNTTFGALRRAVAELPEAVDDTYGEDIASATALLTDLDPWHS